MGRGNGSTLDADLLTGGEIELWRFEARTRALRDARPRGRVGSRLPGRPAAARLRHRPHALLRADGWSGEQPELEDAA